MSFTVTAIGFAVGGVLHYARMQSKMASNRAREAVVQQQKDDSTAQAKAEADAANEANSLRIAQKRAYQANALALGSGDDSLGAPGASSGSVLAAGATSATRAASVAPTSVLGGGAPVTSVGRGSYAGGGGSRSSSRTRMLP